MVLVDLNRVRVGDLAELLRYAKGTVEVDPVVLHMMSTTSSWRGSPDESRHCPGIRLDVSPLLVRTAGQASARRTAQCAGSAAMPREHPLTGCIRGEIAGSELWEDGTRVAMDYSW
ncbi:MAG TPA: hypothetical protein VGA66_07250 [Mycobacterium sp.]